MLLAALAATVAVAQPQVSVTGGRIAGEALPDGSAVFRAVPFARPPVGRLRWKPPQPVRPWKGVRKATKSAPACRQPDQGWNRYGAENQSEDCLYIEVRTPNLKPEKPLPVMVWIHGGSNLAGSGDGTVMSSIVKRGIVLVSIQYRLGAFGFMSHPALTAEAKGHSGNYALMDHQAALRWVQANIRQFGDRNNVTIFGGSAGAQNVGLLMIAAGGRGLFHKAIAESGTAGFGRPPRSLAENERIGSEIAAAAGARGASAAKLRALPASKVLKASQQPLGGRDPATLWSQVTVDGLVLKEELAATVAKGGQAPVPLIIGANAKEFVVGPFASDPAGSVRAVFGAEAEKALAFYGLADGGKGVEDPRLGDTTMQISTDVVFRCPMIAVAKAHVRAGAPVWQYHFDYAPPNGPAASHSSELAFVFNAPGESGTPADAAPLQAYWVNFAKSGDPDGSGLQAWPRYDLERRAYLSFLNSGPRVETRLREPICDNRTLP